MKKKICWGLVILIFAVAVAAGGYLVLRHAHTHSLLALLPQEEWAHVEGVEVAQGSGSTPLSLPDPDTLRAALASLTVREAKVDQTMPERFYVVDIYTSDSKVSLQAADNGSVVVVYLDGNAFYKDGGALFEVLSRLSAE